MAIQELGCEEGPSRRNASYCVGKLCEHAPDQAQQYPRPGHLAELSCARILRSDSLRLWKRWPFLFVRVVYKQSQRCDPRDRLILCQRSGKRHGRRGIISYHYLDRKIRLPFRPFTHLHPQICLLSGPAPVKRSRDEVCSNFFLRALSVSP